MIKAIRGMRDILPPETSRWQWVESVAREVFDLYGYKEIRLPLLERTELFARSIGADTDIVAKEMYTFPDRKGDSLTLRPEATASVVRAVLENRLEKGAGVKKFYTLGPMFRYERPQKGRFPPVLPDQLRGLRGGGAGAGRGSHPAPDAYPQTAAAGGVAPAGQFPGLPRVPEEVQGGPGAVPDQPRGPVRGLPAPPHHQPAPGPGLQERPLPGDFAERPGDPGLSLSRLRRPFCPGAGAVGPV